MVYAAFSRKLWMEESEKMKDGQLFYKWHTSQGDSQEDMT